MSWQKRLLGELCDEGGGLIQTGPFGSQLHQSDYQPFGTPVVMPKDIVDGRVSEDTVARVGQEDVRRLSRHQLEAGDIVYGRRGDIGRCALIGPREKGWLCGTGCLLVRLGAAEVMPDFLFFFLNHPKTIAWIYGQAVGATMPNLNTGILRSVPVRFPDRNTQGRIAAILSAYDVLMENNTQRVAILEEMTRRIYEEWFVHFRAPGCEVTPLLESGLGAIPKGWVVQSIGEITEFVHRGIAPKYDDDANSRVINQKCIRDGRLQLGPARRQSKQVPENKLVRQCDVLINSTGVGTLGRVAQVLDALVDTTIDSHVTMLRPLHDIDPYFFGLSMLRLESVFSEAGIGSTGQTELGRDRIRSQRVIVPPKDLQRMYGGIVRDMRQLTATLERQNVNLRAQRDLLLPKLVSGEIDVSDADQMIREAAE
ncbi:MAG: restriction endonuclease subunit S [Parvibaculaceae bacterium]